MVEKTVGKRTCSFCEVSMPNDHKNFAPGSRRCRRCVRAIHHDALEMNSQKNSEARSSFIRKLKKDAKCIRCGYQGLPVEFCLIPKDGETQRVNLRTGKTVPFSALSVSHMKEDFPKMQLMCRNCYKETKKINWDCNDLPSRGDVMERLRLQPKIDFINAEKYKRGECANCGYEVKSSRLPAFEFDHIDRKTKLINVGCMPGVYSIPAIELEMAKCQMLCARCHAVKSWRERMDDELIPIEVISRPLPLPMPSSNFQPPTTFVIQPIPSSNMQPPTPFVIQPSPSLNTQPLTPFVLQPMPILPTLPISVPSYSGVSAIPALH